MTMKTTFFKVSKMAFFHRGYPMLLAKKCIFFHYLFSLKIRLERRFNNILGRKKNLFWLWEENSLWTQKSPFSKGVNPCFWSNNANLYLFSVKTRLQIVLTDFVDKKETLFYYNSWMFQSPQNHIFPKGLTHAFGQKMPNFSLFLFEIRLEIMLNNLVEKKKTFLDY